MMEAPFLTLPEVRQEVERIFRRDHRSQLVALYGRGETSELRAQRPSMAGRAHAVRARPS
jgi:hypothetical protein